MAGGWNLANNDLASSELYDPVRRDSWTNTKGDLWSARDCHTANLLTDGRVLVAGGWQNTIDINSCEIYNPTTGTWTIA